MHVHGKETNMTDQTTRGKFDEAIDHVNTIIERWLNAGRLQLHCGEMTAQEIRTIRVVLKAIQSEIDQL